ncbi:hypothetical protein OEZ86_012616 [Tetradesmus obliquus]|nr:hypothetical protein OEZ86_012616 [Tetradesmus obliquus]
MRAQLAALQAQHSSLVIKHGFLVGISALLQLAAALLLFGEELFEADGDGVALLKRQLQMPPFPGAEAMSKVDALSMYAGTCGRSNMAFDLAVTDFETGNTASTSPRAAPVQFSQQQKERLAAIHAVYQEFMQRLGAQEVPQLNLGADNQQQHGSTGSSSSNGADGSSSGSSSIPGLQSLSRLQQNLQLWAGVNRLQRKSHWNT